MNNIDPFKFEGKDEDSGAAIHAAIAIKAAAIKAQKAEIAAIAIAASGEIPDGWTYSGPIHSELTRAERREGRVPKIVGAIVTRPAVVADRSGEEIASLVAGRMGTVRFTESDASKSARAKSHLSQVSEFISGFPEITVRDTGDNDVSEYTIFAGPTAVLRHKGFSWSLDALAKSGKSISGREASDFISEAGVWVRI
jgi:hypothetical protein